MEASAQLLPVSDCTSSPRRRSLSSVQSRQARRCTLRPPGPRASHAGWATRSAVAAAATSARDWFGTVPTMRPSAGQRTSITGAGVVPVVAGESVVVMEPPADSESDVPGGRGAGRPDPLTLTQ